MGAAAKLESGPTGLTNSTEGEEELSDPVPWVSCARTLPFTTFPGIKHAVRLANGLRVHWPRDLACESQAREGDGGRHHGKHRRSRRKRRVRRSKEGRPSGFMYVVEDEVLRPVMGKSDEDSDERETIQCCKNDCQFRVDLASALEMCIHLRKVHHDRLFVCPACPGVGAFFYLPGSLRKHVRYAHEKATLPDNMLELQVAYARCGDVIDCPDAEPKLTRPEYVTDEEEEMPLKMPRNLYQRVAVKDNINKIVCLVCLTFVDTMKALDKHWLLHVRE